MGRGGGTPTNKTETKKEEMKKKRIEKEKRKIENEKESKKSSEWLSLWMTGRETKSPEPDPTNPVSKIRQIKKKLGIIEETEKDPEENVERKVKENVRKFENIIMKNRETTRRGLGWNNLQKELKTDPPDNIGGGERMKRTEENEKDENDDEKDDTNGSIKRFWEKKSEQEMVKKCKIKEFGKKKERDLTGDYNGFTYLNAQPRPTLRNKQTELTNEDKWKIKNSLGTASRQHWELIGGESDVDVGLGDQ